jgi:hypothetical protein
MQLSANNRSDSRGRADRAPRSRVHKIAGDVSFLVALFGITALMACEGNPLGSGTGPGVIVITIQPGGATLFLGQTQQFQAIVTGTSNTNVTWTVNGVPGGNATVGSISIGGLYTAPSILPANGTVTVTAVSAASDQASSSVNVKLTDDVVVSVSPASANVPAAGAQVFAAIVTGTGSPSTAVTWSVNGIAGGNSTAGTIVAQRGQWSHVHRTRGTANTGDGHGHSDKRSGQHKDRQCKRHDCVHDGFDFPCERECFARADTELCGLVVRHRRRRDGVGRQRNCRWQRNRRNDCK